MRLVNIDDCNRALFYKQFGGKDSLITVESAFNMLEALPTAYDIDKVVKELEKELSLADKEKERCTGKNHLQFDSAKGYASGISTAIEIVKQGGISDDVCEWIKYDYRTICPKNHDANNPYWRIPDNTDKLKYCPYCGKKIKVVD